MESEKEQDGRFTIRLDEDEFVLFKGMMSEYKRAREERSAFWAAIRRQAAWAFVLMAAGVIWFGIQAWLEGRFGRVDKGD